MPELVALVDASGAVVGRADRSVVRQQNLMHATTSVLVRDARARIYVHRRSPDKDLEPGACDVAAGGVLRPGEEPIAAARRELAEELGIANAELRPLGGFRYEGETTRAVLARLAADQAADYAALPRAGLDRASRVADPLAP